MPTPFDHHSSGLRGQRGITGLETAIILIAFVVVASVFAYTVLTAGIFSSQKSNEAVNAAIDEVRSSIIIGGNTLAYSGQVDTDGSATTTSDTTEAVVRVAMTLTTALQGVPADVTPPYQLNSTTGALESSGLTNSLVINYVDQVQVINNLAYTTTFSGNNDGDFSLEATEKAVLTVWLVEYDYTSGRGLWYNMGAGAADPFIDTTANLLRNFDSFSMEISPVQGAPLVVERVIPQAMNPIMNLR